MITNSNIYHYLEWEATKIIAPQGKYKLLSSSIEFYKPIKKIKKGFADQTDISKNAIKITIVIDDCRVIGTFNYKIN